MCPMTKRELVLLGLALFLLGALTINAAVSDQWAAWAGGMAGIATGIGVVVAVFKLVPDR
jgi:hypothetical protein